MHDGSRMGVGIMGGQGMMGGRGMMGRKSSPSQATKGAASTYANLCASCHGATGKGDGPAAMALNPRPGDFTDCKRMATHTDGFLSKIIREGGARVKHSPLMSAWGGTLSDQQIQGLVGYIRGLCNK
ncbi:MAG: c-type cytochrome [Candidatus Binatia bacterium]